MERDLIDASFNPNGLLLPPLCKSAKCNKQDPEL